MKTVCVNLGDRSYSIHIGTGLLGQVEPFQSCIKGRDVVVITNTTVEKLYGKKLMDTLKSIARTHLISLADGEAFKNLDSTNHIFDRLLSIPCDRKSTLIALGGGVVGDITGFAAACYLRGISYIHVPTTLLAQVDSSIGGKTGVNHPLGKNMIGAIHQPLTVVADIETLQTLPKRELRAGLAEVIKYGFIRDAEFFNWLQDNVQLILERDATALSYAVEKSVHNKARVVEQDEFESGIRAILNYGHTFGHAIEGYTQYADYLHGEAVAIGMRMAAHFSHRLGQLQKSEAAQSIELIENCELPTSPPRSMTENDFLNYMSRDKKVDTGTIRFITLEKIGKAKITSSYPDQVLLDTIRQCSSVS